MRAKCIVSKRPMAQTYINCKSYVEVSRRQTTIAVSQGLDRHNNENQRDGYHQKAKRDVASILNASFARWESSGVYAINGPVAQDECQVAQRIKDGIRHGGEERQRARSNGSIDLEDSQAAVGLHDKHQSELHILSGDGSARARSRRTYDERSMHGDLVLQALTLLLLFRFPDVVVNRLEQAFNVLVLSLVEGLQLAVLGVLVDCIGEADAAAAFAGGVGADLVELVDGLQAMA